MKVLFVTQETPLYTQAGGICTYIEHAASALIKAQITPAIITWGYNINKKIINKKWVNLIGEGNIATINISDKDFNLKNKFKAFEEIASAKIAEKLQEEIIKIKPDYIETTDYSAPLYSFLESKRAGLLQIDIPVFVFNHGLSIDVWTSNADWPNDLNIINGFAREYKQMQWADGIICPSITAAENIKKMGIDDNKIQIIKEPYEPKSISFLKTGRIRKKEGIAHLGRFTYGKGADEFIYNLNLIEGEIKKIGKIKVAGKEAESTFKSDFKKIYNQRIDPLLRKNTKWIDNYQREEISDILSDIEYVFNLSRSETFSYTTVEAIFNNCIPITHIKSAMAEFFPAELVDGLLKESYPDANEMKRVLSYWESEKDLKKQKLLHFNTETLSYKNYTQNIKKLINGYFNNAHKNQTINPNEEKTVSIIICHKDDIKHLPTAVRSAIQQSYKIKELIIVDDGSHDTNVKKFLDTLSEQKNNIEIKIIYNTNLGLTSSRLVGLANCSSEWVVFLDSDDYLSTDFIFHCVTAQSINKDADAIITERKNFGVNEETYIDAFIGTPFHWLYNNLRMTALIKTDIVRNIGFKRSMRNGEADDWIFWLQFTSFGYKAVTLPKTLFFYNFREGSMSWPWSKGQALITNMTIENLLDELIVNAPKDSINYGRKIRQIHINNYNYYLMSSINSMEITSKRQIIEYMRKNNIIFRKIYAVKPIRKLAKKLILRNK